MQARFIWLWRVLIIAAGLTIPACVKNDNFLEPYRFIAYVDPVNGVGGYNTLSTNMLVLRDTILPGTAMSFAVKLFAAYDKEVTLTAKIETSLIADYDRLAQSPGPSPALPDGAFGFANAGVTIPAGATASADSIKLVLLDASHLDLTGSDITYTIPVRLSSTLHGALSTEDTLRQTMFFRVTFTKVSSAIPSQGDSIQYIQFIRQSDGTLLERVTGFGASINTAATIPLQIGISLAPSLVEKFNVANHTSYTALPPAFFSLAQSSVTIPPGGMNSALDSFRILFAGMPQPGKYLLPLQMKDEGAVIPGANKAVYVAVETVPEIIYARTNWRIVAVSADNYHLIDNLLDGKYYTNWLSALPEGYGLPPQWFTIDMGQVNLIRGIMIRYSPYETGWQPGQAKVYTSMDNQTWDAGQTIDIPMAAVPERNMMVHLPASVSGRYIKFEVTAVQGAPPTGVSMIEFAAF